MSVRINGDTLQRWMIGALALLVTLSVDVIAEPGRSLSKDSPRGFQFTPTGGYIVAGSNRLRFYAASGRELHSFRIKRNQIPVTPGGAVVGLTTFADNQPSGVRPIRFEVYDARGKRLLRLKKPPFNSVIMAPEASAFVGLRGVRGFPETTLLFLDANGNVRDSLAVTHFAGGRFTDDGGRFFFEANGEGLICRTARGAFHAKYGRATAWATSSDGRRVALAGPDLIRVYDDTLLIHRIDWPRAIAEPIRALTFSADGGRFAAMSTDRIVVYDVTTGQQTAAVAPGVADGAFRSVALDRSGERIAAGIDLDDRSLANVETMTGLVIVYEHGERVLLSDPLKYDHGSSRFPLVTFLADGQAVAAITRAQMLRFELP